MHMYICTNNSWKKKVVNLKENKEGFVGVFRWRKRKGEMMQLYYNLKNNSEIISEELVYPYSGCYGRRIK